MHVRTGHVGAVLALVALLFGIATATAQTKAPARAPQRSPSGVRQASDQQPAGQPSARSAAPREPAGAAPRPAPGAPPSMVPAKRPPAAPQAPFVLTESQQNLLDQILAKWEQSSAKISTFKCSFTCWKYDPAYGAQVEGVSRYLLSEAEGYIKYKSPDRGDYSITAAKEWNGKDFAANKGPLDHWICDGQSIFEFATDKKQLIERKLPPEMRGKAITEGPLPFLFGAKAEQLKSRYWMRDITPKDQIGKQVRLEAFPKRQQDAANFQRAELILTDPGFLPFGLQIDLPGAVTKSGNKAHHDYVFKDPKVNDPLSILKLDFMPPMTPFGWKKVVEDDGADVAKEPAPPADKQGQAKRTAPVNPRK